MTECCIQFFDASTQNVENHHLTHRHTIVAYHYLTDRHNIVADHYLTDRHNNVTPSSRSSYYLLIFRQIRHFLLIFNMLFQTAIFVNITEKKIKQQLYRTPRKIQIKKSLIKWQTHKTKRKQLFVWAFSYVESGGLKVVL